FGLTHCSNGDFLQYINDAGHLEEEVVRFCATQLIEALEQLHIRHIIYRDLKQENILLTDGMHIQLIDFGSSTIIDNNEVPQTDSNDSQDEKKKIITTKEFICWYSSICSTIEILQDGPIHFGSDPWSLGCSIYQMVTGKHLFCGYHEYDIFNDIVRVASKLPDDSLNTIGDLIQKLAG
ncbi:unnamed protein product, partial [Rotaria sp. Silwood2]